MIDRPPIADASDLPLLLSLAQAARLTGLAERSFWRLSRSGDAPPPIRLAGRTVRYSRDALQEWVAAGCPRVAPQEGNP